MPIENDAESNLAVTASHGALSEVWDKTIFSRHTQNVHAEKWPLSAYDSSHQEQFPDGRPTGSYPETLVLYRTRPIWSCR
jgi:hypothetical protein